MIMKTFLAIIASTVLATGIYAQGYVTFTASGSAHPIEYSPSGPSGTTPYTKVPVGNPAQIPGFGNLNVAIYYAPVGTVLSAAGGLPDLSGWSMATPDIQSISPVAGQIPATKITMSGATGGNPIELEVVGWTGTATSFTAAEASGSWLAFSGDGASGGASGGALGWSNPTGTTTSPANVIVGTGGFNGLVLGIDGTPEPSSFALLGLGVAGMALLRKKKRSSIQK